MKKVILALIAVAFSASALAAEPSGVTSASANGANAAQLPPLANADPQSAESMRLYLPQTEGVDEVYDAYIKNGYQPVDAAMLASWDSTEAFRAARPGLRDNPSMKEEVERTRQKYKPVK
jgi:hypothetical protein